MPGKKRKAAALDPVADKPTSTVSTAQSVQRNIWRIRSDFLATVPSDLLAALVYNRHEVRRIHGEDSYVAMLYALRYALKRNK